MRFIATASVVCASVEIEPRLIAPVAKRLTIAAAGSTSSSGTGVALGRPELEQAAQRLQLRCVCSLISAAYSLVRRVAVRARRVLQLRDRIRRPHVLFAAHAVRVLAARVERVARAADRRRTRARAAARASSATSNRPMPSTLLAVPVKYLSTNAFCRPTASKICAPQYDWYVEMPILDITL